MLAKACGIGVHLDNGCESAIMEIEKGRCR